MRHPEKKSRGLALPLVLWSIAFLAGLVVLVSGVVGDWSAEEARAGRKFQARQLALSGVAMGLNPAIKVGEPLLKKGTPDSEGFEVKISNESGKINPNFWLAQNNRDIFVRLLDSWDTKQDLRDAAIDGLIDWIDGDDFKNLHGAESAEYAAMGRPGFPANRPLVHAREMEAVLGLDTVLAGREDWRDYFTTWHNGKINLQYATEPVLTSLAELTPRQCAALFELRAGPDSIEGNEDDVRFESIDDVAKLIGTSGVQLEALENFFDVTGSVRRIESTGFCYGTKHRIVVIVPEEGGGGQIMSWEEQ